MQLIVMFSVFDDNAIDHIDPDYFEHFQNLILMQVKLGTCMV